MLDFTENKVAGKTKRGTLVFAFRVLLFANMQKQTSC